MPNLVQSLIRPPTGNEFCPRKAVKTETDYPVMSSAHPNCNLLPSHFTIRRLLPGDENAYRDIRLRMLREQPSAFVTSYEEELSKPASHVRSAMGLSPKTEKTSRWVPSPPRAV